MLKKGTAVSFGLEMQSLYYETTVCSKARKQREECMNYSWRLDIMVMEKHIYMQCLNTYVNVSKKDCHSFPW